MKIKVFIQVAKEKITCICLQSNKRCRKYCEKTEVEYDQYQKLRECFDNKGNKNYKNT